MRIPPRKESRYRKLSWNKFEVSGQARLEVLFRFLKWAGGVSLGALIGSLVKILVERIFQ